MTTEALQIKYTKDEYDLYKKCTHNLRHRQLGFLFAMFKIRNNNHIQCAISGEYGQGKSSAAIVLAKWETRYLKALMKWYDKMGMKFEMYSHDYSNVHFGVEKNIIISPDDPASKYIYAPESLNSYIIDDGYFFTTTGEANTVQTRKIQKAITGNRKKNISAYWIFPNVFKMPTAILEVMDIWIHKENLQVGDVIIPSRVIQLKEKFAKDKIEKYAKHPKAFKNLIKFHPSFISKIKFPKIKGKNWEKYNLKYDKYKPTEENTKEKINARIEFFQQLEKVLEKNIRITTTAKAREELINGLVLNALKKKSKNEAQAKQIAASFTDQFIKWQEDKLAGQLTKELSNSLLSSTELEISEEAEPMAEEAGA